jgi:hypothetical protein
VRNLGLVAVLVSSAACFARVEDGDGSGGGGPGGGADDGSSSSPDASPPPLPDAAPAAVDNPCGVASDQGDIGTVAASGERRNQGSGGNGPYIYSLAAPTPGTAGDPKPDMIYIELWDGYGGFGSGVSRPGTYPITGDELSYETCGVCVFTLADVDPATGNPTRYLFHTAGSVEVIAVSATANSPLQVRALGVTFDEIQNAPPYPPVPSSDCPSPLAAGQLQGTAVVN